MTLATIEQGEVFPSCFVGSQFVNEARTVWYRFTPTANMTLAMGRGSDWDGPVIAVYTGSEFADLVESTCHWYGWGNGYYRAITVSHGTTYWFQVISWTNETVEFALFEPEPPSVSFGFYPQTPVRGGNVNFYPYFYDPVGLGFDYESCQWNFGDSGTATGCYPQHVYADVGVYTVEMTAYTFDGRSAMASQVITVGEPEPPSAWIDFSPTDPAPGDLIVFSAALYDPSGIGFDYNTCQWDFGDGITSTTCWPQYTYSTEGDYTVTLRANTYDGREAMATRVVPVRTHDVSIIKVTVPQSARAGQTRQIVVGVSNKLYPETVQVTLSKGGANYYDEQIGVLTQLVPVRSGNRTTDFQFSYTFTEQDAAVGKVTFKANAQLVNARDSYPFRVVCAQLNHRPTIRISVSVTSIDST